MSTDGYFSDINPSTTSGTQLATLLNAFKNMIASGSTGTARPTNLAAGGSWIDTTNGGSPTFTWVWKIYDGTSDITLFSINIQSNTIVFPGSDDSFAITKTSADTAGALLKLIKRRIANNGQVFDGDTIAEVQFVGSTNDPADVITAKIVAVASDNFTSSAQGTYLKFMCTTDASATLSEMMRLVDGKLGIGTSTPQERLHVEGNAKVSKNSDDAVGAKIMVKKSRVAGTKAVQSSDVLAEWEIYSTDDSAADLNVLECIVTATENHTSTNGGVKFELFMNRLAAVVKTLKVQIIDKIMFLKDGVSIEALILEQQAVATSATIAALDASKSVVMFTGSTATSLQGVDATGNCKALLIHNKSSADIAVKHADSGATATNRFDLPNGRDITISAGSSLEVFYDETATRWKLKSGSSAGGGGYTVTTTVETVSASAALTTSLVDSRQLRFVKGASGGVVASTTPFGTGTYLDGAEIQLVGQSDDDFLVIPKNDASNGVVGNFSDDGIELRQYSTARFIRDNTRSRWVYAGGI